MRIFTLQIHLFGEKCNKNIPSKQKIYVAIKLKRNAVKREKRWIWGWK